jgi:hypothetical protein
MDSVSAYLAEKIELALTFYESRLARIDKNYLAGIDRLANRTRDRVLADFFRQTMNPGRISSALSHIRFCLSQGQIVEADKALERLKSSIDTVEGYLRRPVLNAGLGTSRGGAIGALAKHGDPKDRAAKRTEMRESFENLVKKGMSKAEAEQSVARTFRVSPRTVRSARTGK